MKEADKDPEIGEWLAETLELADRAAESLSTDHIERRLNEVLSSVRATRRRVPSTRTAADEKPVRIEDILRDVLAGLAASELGQLVRRTRDELDAARAEVVQARLDASKVRSEIDKEYVEASLRMVESWSRIESERLRLEREESELEHERTRLARERALALADARDRAHRIVEAARRRADRFTEHVRTPRPVVVYPNSLVPAPQASSTDTCFYRVRLAFDYMDQCGSAAKVVPWVALGARGRIPPRRELGDGRSVRPRRAKVKGLLTWMKNFLRRRAESPRVTRDEVLLAGWMRMNPLGVVEIRAEFEAMSRSCAFLGGLVCERNSPLPIGHPSGEWPMVARREVENCESGGPAR